MNLAEFIAWAIREGSWQGCNLDGGDVQDKAVEMGILVETKYNPRIHGENDCDAEPGCPWFVFSPAFKTALARK